jgi:hypothetical protein
VQLRRRACPRLLKLYRRKIDWDYPAAKDALVNERQRGRVTLYRNTQICAAIGSAARPRPYPVGAQPGTQATACVPTSTIRHSHSGH